MPHIYIDPDFQVHLYSFLQKISQNLLATWISTILAAHSLAQEANVGNPQSKEQASQLLREASADVQRQVLTRGGLRPLDFKSGGFFLNKLDDFF